MVNWPQELQITNLVPTSSLRHKKVAPSISRKVSQFISVLHVKARCQRRLKEQFFSGSKYKRNIVFLQEPEFGYRYKLQCNQEPQVDERNGLPSFGAKCHV